MFLSAAVIPNSVKTVQFSHPRHAHTSFPKGGSPYKTPKNDRYYSTSPLFSFCSQTGQAKRPRRAGPFCFGLPGLCPVESPESYACLGLLYECLSLIEKDFWPLAIGKQGTIPMHIVTQFFTKVNTKLQSKVHFQYERVSRYVPKQSEILWINVTILPIYAKSPMIQVIRLFLVYAVVIYLHFVVV